MAEASGRKMAAVAAAMTSVPPAMAAAALRGDKVRQNDHHGARHEEHRQ
jgi:hypothetical protein